jgi:hypothetical protein
MPPSKKIFAKIDYKGQSHLMGERKVTNAEQAILYYRPADARLPIDEANGGNNPARG